MAVKLVTVERSISSEQKNALHYTFIKENIINKICLYKSYFYRRFCFMQKCL